MQNDFIPGGTLGVKGGNEVIPLIDKLVHLDFDVIVATQDWHPKNHGSFAVNHPGKQLGEVIKLHGINQILWPVHCIQGTDGSALAPLGGI